MASEAPDRIFHIAARSEWEAARGAPTYAPGRFAHDGFVHCSSAAQLIATTNRHFGGRSDLVLLELDVAALDAPLRWEAAPSGEVFPHLYGPVAAEAVVGVCDWPADSAS